MFVCVHPARFRLAVRPAVGNGAVVAAAADEAVMKFKIEEGL